MKKRRHSLFLLLLVLVLSACSREPERNTNPATSVWNVMAQGNGAETFVCAFILKDAEFNDTANNGTVTMEIKDIEGVIFSLTWTATEERFRYVELFSLPWTDWSATETAAEERFRIEEATKGSQSEERLLYAVDRFEYSRFSREPVGDIGQVIIVFDNGSSVMRGYGRLLFEHH